MDLIVRPLSITQRLSIIQLLPKASNRIEMLMVRNIVKAIEMNTEEVEELTNNVDHETGGLKLAPEENIVTDRKFTPKQIAFIGKQLEELDKANKVTRNTLDLFDLFTDEEIVLQMAPQSIEEIPDNQG